MRTIVNITAGEASPSIETVLKSQGIPVNTVPNGTVIRTAEETLAHFMKSAKPMGMVMEISTDQFADVFLGEGKNEADAPLGQIYKSAETLALFAVTLGNELSGEISKLFDKGEFPLAVMLDSAGSEGAEMAAERVEAYFRTMLKKNNRLSASTGIMRFSPGYCGWDITGQKKLFGALHPQEIGIELNESCLMQPLKSVSGVIVAGKKEIFEFDDTFSFCADCATHSCCDRITNMMNMNSHE